MATYEVQLSIAAPTIFGSSHITNQGCSILATTKSKSKCSTIATTTNKRRQWIERWPHSSRGRGRGRGPPRLTNKKNQPRMYYCTFHGKHLDHATDFCPETKKTFKRITEEKIATTVVVAAPKTINHTSFWSQKPYYPVYTLPNSNTVHASTLASSFTNHPFNYQPRMMWQPSPQFQSQSRAALQTASFAPPQPIQEIPLPPTNLPNQIPKAKPNNGQNSNPKALPTYSMITPILGGSSQELENT